MEPAGALAIAGAKAYVERAALTSEPIKDQTLITVACGANMNFDRLRFVAERAELGEAQVFVGVQIADRGESGALARRFEEHDFKTLDLTHDVLAKTHLRHLVGGKSGLAKDELLYRFEFPERPGALMRFLDSMAPNWNISLCHYRNQGGDVGRIVIGLQVPPDEMNEFASFLNTLGYRYWDESSNPVYKLFLG